MTDKTKDWASLQEESAAIESDNLADDAASILGDTPPLATAALDFPTHAELEAQLNEAEQKYENAKDEAARARAELENVRKRAQRDVDNAYKFGLEKFVRGMLDVADSLDHAVVACENANGEISALKEGVILTTKLMQDTLVKFNVTLINPVDEIFDPNRHEAISMQEIPGAVPNSVIAVVQKGYSLNERVIRPARVIIAKNSS